MHGSVGALVVRGRMRHFYLVVFLYLLIVLGLCVKQVNLVNRLYSLTGILSLLSVT